MLKSLIKFLFGQREADDAKEKNVTPPDSRTDDSVRFAAGDFPADARKIDPAFDNYSDSFPPDWEARRIAVLRADNFICQAPGCLESGNHLHVHHIQERWKGGNHKLENLVSLCPAHHALVHLGTNKVTFQDARYKIVSRHWRRKRFSSEKIEVRSHIQRLTRITPAELKEVRKQFDPQCHWCNKKTGWALDWRRKTIWREALIWTWCPECNGRWEFEPGLKEETATQLVLAFLATQNLGRFKFNADLIHGIRSPVSFEGCPECLRHGRRGYLKAIDGQFGSFLGCNEWPACRYTREIM